MLIDLFNLYTFVKFSINDRQESEGGFSIIGPKIEKTKSQGSDDWIVTKIKQ